MRPLELNKHSLYVCLPLQCPQLELLPDINSEQKLEIRKGPDSTPNPNVHQRRRIQPKKSTQNKTVLNQLNKFFRTISVGFLTHVTGKKAKVRANISKSSCETSYILWRYFHRVLQGAAQRGAQFYFIFAVLRTLFSCSEKSLFSLKTCTPVQATP